MKKCQKCKKVKPIEEFHRNKMFADGYAQRCKECRKPDGKQHYQKHQKHIKDRMCKYYRNGGKEVAQKRHRKPEVQDQYYQYKQNAKYKNKAHAYMTTPEYRKKAKEAYQKNRQNFKAYYAVKEAIKQGILKHPTDYKCDKCGKNAEIYHHHSYKPKFWLDVIPLCQRCHMRGHKSLILIPIDY